jgi:hypothetical protein
VYEQSAEVAMEVSTVVFEADSDTLIDCTTGVIVPREQELVIEKELPTEDSAAMPYCPSSTPKRTNSPSPNEAFGIPSDAYPVDLRRFNQRHLEAAMSLL